MVKREKSVPLRVQADKRWT